jgi:hypothetical protein
MSRRSTLLIFALAFFGLSGTATAARNLETGIADTVYRSGSTAGRDAALDRTVREGAGIIRIDVLWRHVVGDSRPLTPRNPADLAYDFGDLDAAVQAASARGLDVLFTVYSAPNWAEGPNRPPISDDALPGTWQPDPADLADFATALATRYSGAYTPPGTTKPLPAVRHYEAWNEENLWVFLGPQYDGKHQESVELYRKLLDAFGTSIKAVSPKADVLIGGGAPYGDPPGGFRTRPILFLRDLFCLRRSLKPKKCPDPVDFDILGVHPINLSGGPRRSAIDPDDASSADVKNIVRVLRAAEKQNTVGGGHHEVWATEFWWESYPDGPHKAIPGLDKHGIWIEEAMYLFWKAGVKVAITLQLDDAPASTRHEFEDTFQAGLFLANGDPKPAATSFRFPFVLDPRSGGKVLAWGKAPEAGKLTIEKKRHGGWRNVATLHASKNRVFAETLALRGNGEFRATVGGENSLVWSLRK